MSGAPMSNEQRAALEQRLAQLRAAQQAGGAAAAPPHARGPAPPAAQQQQQQQQRAYAPPGGRPAPQMGYGYDDDDDEEEEEEEEFDIGRQQFEEEFLRMLAAQQRQQQQQHAPHFQRQVPQHERNAASVAQVNATRHADDGVDIIATDKTAQRSRELSDFEALRLAKMGDAASMLDFGSACGIDWKIFVDNHGRNALHYAADAGAAELIRKLSDDLRVPYVADEKKLTPLDVAVLNGHGDVQTDEVVAALVAAAAASRHADARLADPQNATTLESVLQAHAPAPPKFVMSKPVPKPVEATGARTFWSASAAAAPPSSSSASVVCSSGADVSAEEAAQVAEAVSQLDQHGRFEWLLPLTRGAAAPCQRWQVARSVASSGASTTGVVVAQLLANSTLAGSAARRIKTNTGDGAAKMAVAAHLGVRATAHKSGVAAALLHSLRTQLRRGLPDGGDALLFFASGAPLPRPPTPVATVKWYRRVFDPVAVYASDSAYDVFPDFYTYDAVLRADAVLKGALPQQLSEAYASAMPSWCDIDATSEEQCEIVLRFIAGKAGTSDSCVDLACVPQDVAELRRVYLEHPDHRAFVRTDAAGAVTDLVVLRRRDARKHVNDGTFAAELVYALFTSVTGTAKADHLMLIAAKLLMAKMLLVPTLFGLTESDLAKANLDEVTASREYVYGVSLSTLRDVEGLGVVPAARLSLPLYSI